MEHHIAQSSPISPRQKGMEGSRQALLYGVYDAFAGALCTLISRRLCALITAIGIAVFTISSSAWATHNPETPGVGGGLPTPGTTPEEVIDTADSSVIGDIQEGAVHTEEIGDGEVNLVDLAGDSVDSSKIVDGSVTGGLGGPGGGDIAQDTITGGNILDGTITGHTGPATPGDIAPNTIQAEDIAPDAVTNSELADNAVEEENIRMESICGSGDDTVDCDGSGSAKTHIKPGTIGTADLADGAVTTDEIEDGTITSDDLQAVDPMDPTTTPGAVGNGNIQGDAVTTDKIGAGEVCGSVATAECTTPMEADINEGSIGTADLANGGVELEDLDGDSVDSSKIVDRSITSADLEVVDPTPAGGGPATLGAVDTNNIREDAVTTSKIDNDAVTTGKILDQTVTGSGDDIRSRGDIAGETITENEIRDEAVRSQEIAENTIRHEDIRDEAVRSEEIEDLTIRSEDLRDDSVINAKLVDVNDQTGTGGAVSTSKINDDAVTSRKLADINSDEGAAVNTDNIRDEAVTTRTIDDLGVTTEKLARVDDQGRGGAVSNNNINDDAITFRKIGRDAVGSIHIQERAVRGNHIGLGQVGLEHLGTDVNNVFRRIEGAIDRLDEGIAMSHAISMIKVPQGKEFGISFAGGFYQDKQAAAIGVGFRPTDGLLLSAGASYGFDSEEVGGAVSINFGF